ncbi:50S ribosome-binding GTPase [Halomonas aquamarina]|uniref:50S ribosome-binding GTPase n=1 Tax=Vreelandella aquamarina TaxID=77097 RepID=A0ACC5VYL3_9GAMM|nr:GTPase [Halomonas aquamarina]MBZ5488953.1 50S ribosome-binding GTPase [Halomonas aquamarina]
MSDYRDFLGDSYNEESGEFYHNKAKDKAVNEKERCNIIISGASGVGKSTLINAIFGDEVVKAGAGKPVTQHLEKVAIPEKGICLWDTKGIEAKNYQDTMSSLENEFRQAIDNANDDCDIPHIGWVCIKASSDRVEDRDLTLIGLLAKRNIPAIIVFTRVTGKAEREFVEEAKLIIDKEYKNFVRGAYVSVNSVPYEIDEDFVVKVKGLESLIEVTEARFPEGKKSAKNAFLKAQRLKIEKRLAAMKEGARKVVHFASAAAGTAGASPIPGSDAPIIAAIQSTMIYKINTEFELDADNSKMTSVLTGIMGITALAQVGKTVVSNALKFIPGAGTLIGGAISATTAIAITEAVGHAYIAVLEKFFDIETGEVVLPENSARILSVFKDVFSYKV